MARLLAVRFTITFRVVLGFGFVLLLVLTLCGCKSRALGPYTAPRVVGRVVEADTLQPVAEVRVQRGSAAPVRPGSLRGGELLMEKVPVLTDAEGRFELPSWRALTVLRPSGWNSVTLTFERAGYERLKTNFPATDPSTNTNANTSTNANWTTAPGSVIGEPLIDVGTVSLKRLGQPQPVSVVRPTSASPLSPSRK